jgi:hypothetical protein
MTAKGRRDPMRSNMLHLNEQAGVGCDDTKTAILQGVRKQYLCNGLKGVVPFRSERAVCNSEVYLMISISKTYNNFLAFRLAKVNT